MFPLLPSVLAPIEGVLENALISIHTSTGLSWAWSIIVLTAIVRLVILPVTVAQTRNMLAMQRLAPYMKQLQQKYKDDRQELNVRLMEFYRVNKVNPLASCFPLLLQLPVFIALFYVLKDFRPPAEAAADFTFLGGLIDNIRATTREHGGFAYALLAFYVGSQVFASKVMVTSPDPRQKMLFMAMPVFFVPFILIFPIGVMLYWITTNLWTLGQHVVVVRLTDTAKPVVMPEDSRGRRKEIVPKDVKAELRRREQAKQGNAVAAGKESGTQRTKRARKNKRRR